MTEARELLAEYAQTGSESAFREVVTSHLNLVYSTALRLVDGDTHSAEDITQRVFADLAKIAGHLSRDVMLGGWLHRHTCYIASKTLRTERRRQAREQQAVLMNDLDQPSPGDVAALSPILDEAVNKLGATDRQAVLLRFFEQRDFRSVGEALGSNEEAARKRVNRALDKLRTLLKRRGVTLSSTALATVLTSQAVSVAPAGLAVAISTGAIATAAAGGGTALTILQIMSMTKLQGGIIAAVIITLSVPLAIQHRTAKELRRENESLRAEVQQVATLTAENERLSNLLARAAQPVAKPAPDTAREVLKLRGEVGALRKTADEASALAARASEAPLSDVTANPEMNRMIRDQQKMAMSMIYRGLTNRAKLNPETAGALNDLLADNVMTNISLITAMIKSDAPAAERERMFAEQEAATNAKVKDLLGSENYQTFEEYNRHLASYLTSEQFKGMLSGDSATKDAQAKKLYELMREETRRTLTARGLGEDYQTVPTLNFRSFTSEEESERSLQLLDSIYEQVQSGAAAFLSEADVVKFAEFRKLAINNNRVALAVNRKLMTPGTKQ